MIQDTEHDLLDRIWNLQRLIDLKDSDADQIVKRLEARIRELEQQVHLAMAHAGDMEDRIAKAKAILEEWSHEKYVQAGEPLTVSNIQRALEALDGK